MGTKLTAELKPNNLTNSTTAKTYIKNKGKKKKKRVRKMLDSLTKTMSRSSGFMGNLKDKSTASNSSSSFSTMTNHTFGSAGSKSYKSYKATVIFLDDSCHTFYMDKKARGSTLLDMVYDYLELNEREYFGLVFNDLSSSSSTTSENPGSFSPDFMRWLDEQKPVRKQLRTFTGSGGNAGKSILGGSTASQPTLFFRVKFYVTDPSRLQEEFTRYHLYLQVKKDLVDGNLTAPISTVCLLTSYAVQSSLGDYDPETCRSGYLDSFKNLRKHCAIQQQQQQNPLTEEEIERRITELHKLHKSQSPAEAEFNFLEHAKRLEMYGISLHSGKDSSGKDIFLGVTSMGLVVFQNKVKINTFSWSKIVKISFKRKQFFIQLRKELTENYDTLLGFNLASYRSCKNLWKSAVEHHSFFRLHSPKPPPRRFLLNLGSKFRYSGRTEFQALPEKTRTFPRSAASRKTLPVFLDSVKQQQQVSNAQLTGRIPRLASPETSSIGSSIHSNGIFKPPVRPTAPPQFGSSVLGGSSGQVGSVTGSSAGSTISLAHRAIESFNNKVQSLSTKLPKKAWQEEVTSDDDGGFLDNSRKISSLGRLSNVGISTPNKAQNTTATSSTTSSSSTKTATSRSFRQIPLMPTALPIASRIPFADDSSMSGQSSIILFPPPSSQSTPKKSIVIPKLIHPDTKSSSTNSTPSRLDKSRAVVSSSTTLTPNKSVEEISAVDNSSSSETNGGLVIIVIVPDEKGRFGFNVKGGADQKLPIIVSRVGANTPADKCFPKLNEGDQVVQINGRDVSGHTHDQVVNSIRASSEPHSGQLILAVKQNVYIGEEVEEPEFQYVPEAPLVSPQIPGTKALSQSMLLLEESLDSGAVIGQFEQLYRRNPGMLMSICHASENVVKNRYRDISPYDSTRFILHECPSGDYINANHVVMTIPGSGIVNRYIATQGPLNVTTGDFWFMSWESQSNLVIMLTTIVERGRVKCHKYWPDLEQTLELEGGLSVKCTKEDEHSSFAFRDFEMTYNSEVRHITQMAYSSWPDHGVPESSDEFVNFVERVRNYRQGSMYPTVVHCSAGIGRTGVLILMETALCLIEANQPVYPLDLTKQMRDQRASMIQTPSQYKFVCEAILKVYAEGKVEPLPEFCQSNNNKNGASIVPSMSSSSLVKNDTNNETVTDTKI